jgi:DNA repair protein SbcC/Rad50
MRPLKLVMTAFGPYADVQVIDFRAATDAGLFGIYGPTGAGKSSIFSAITFALFGKAAKEAQSIGSLRSHHADPGRLTEVALVFELAQRRYLVRRQPDQLRPRARGDGETEQSHAAWLFDVTDVEFDAIDCTGCGKPLAEKNVRVVGDKIKDLLGYGVEQFRQTILLPQGEFERFLTSNSNERLAILRELFDVSLYRRVTETLKEQAKAAVDEIRQSRMVLSQRLFAEGFASSDELTTGITDAEQRKQQLDKEAIGKESELARADAALNAAQDLDGRFVEHEKARTALTVLQDKAPVMQQIRERRNNAERAKQASDVHAAIADAELELSEAATAELEVERTTATATATLTAARTSLEQARANEGEIELGRQRRDELLRHQKAVQDAADLHEELGAAISVRRELAQKVQDAQTQVTESITAQDNAEERLRDAQRTENRRRELAVERAKLVPLFNDAKAFDQAGTALASARNALVEAEEKVEARTVEFKRADQHAKEREQKFLEAQSAIIAKTLIDGAPCPVCGSADHPSPAHAEMPADGLEDDWNDARQALAKVDATLQQARQDRAAAADRVEERQTRLNNLAAPDRSLEQLEDAIELLDTEIADLGPSVDEQALEGAFSRAKQRVAQARTDCEKAREKHGTALTAESIARRSYEDEIGTVPEQYRVAEAISEELTAIENRIDSLRNAVVDAQEALQLATANEASAQAHLMAAKQHRAKANDAVTKCKDKFTRRLQDLELSEDDFVQFVADVPLLEELKRQIDDYDEQLRLAEGALRQTTQAIEGKQRPDLENLRGAASTARTDASSAREAATTAANRHTFLVRLQQELSDELQRLNELEESTGPLRALDEACSGRNPMNMMLETFAIGTLFDEVLGAANLRLEPMTNGRYRLERELETTGGRTRRGLDIRVHDIETGRSRELSTLSGGETFIAALSLALGLSDVVEMTHGGIRLDTVFVDEGFGSLDADSDGGTLETVLQVLQEIVGSSRAVGLISHVPLVQQAVPHGFSVHKGIGGSYVELRAA